MEDVEGYFASAAVAACDALLQHQAAHDIYGKLLEIGAWQGRSAILWLVHARQGERVHVVDAEEHPALRPNLARAAAAVNQEFIFTRASSFRFPDAPFSVQNRRSIRLVHIDGDHSAAGVWNDIDVCADLLHMHGLMVIDDFMNVRFPQITEVVFAFLAQRSHEFGLLGCGGNKAFIVHAKFFEFWSAFARDGLPSALKERLPSFDLYETTVAGRPCFGLR